jgi:Ca2+-binding EF-hand superfamily protein
VYTERVISIDDAHEILKDIRNNSKAFSVTDDIQTLQSMLLGLFREADVANNGYLNYEQFHGLMDKIDLGITEEELRYI